MNKLTLFLLLISSYVSAEPISLHDNAVAIYERGKVRCKSYDTVASTVMTSRQSGMPLDEAKDKLMPLVSEFKFPKEVKKEVSDYLMTSMIQRAYKTPIQPTEEMQDKAIAEFGHDYYLRCLRPFTFWDFNNEYPNS